MQQQSNEPKNNDSNSPSYVTTKNKPVRKRRILVGSAKDKGRRLQHWVCEQISRVTGYPWGTSGQDAPIESRPMGQPGADIRMESRVRELFPFSVECKNQESWSVLAWVEQARKNQIQGTDWLLVLKKNFSEPVVVLDAEVFFRIIGENIKSKVKQ